VNDLLTSLACTSPIAAAGTVLSFRRFALELPHGAATLPHSPRRLRSSLLPQLALVPHTFIGRMSTDVLESLRRQRANIKRNIIRIKGMVDTQEEDVYYLNHIY